MKNKCIVCGNNAKEKFPFRSKIVHLCWNCNHKVYETMAAIHDGHKEEISNDIVILSLAKSFHETHRDELVAVIGGSTL